MGNGDFTAVSGGQTLAVCKYVCMCACVHVCTCGVCVRTCACVCAIMSEFCLCIFMKLENDELRSCARRRCTHRHRLSAAAIPLRLRPSPSSSPPSPPPLPSPPILDLSILRNLVNTSPRPRRPAFILLEDLRSRRHLAGAISHRVRLSILRTHRFQSVELISLDHSEIHNFVTILSSSLSHLTQSPPATDSQSAAGDNKNQHSGDTYPSFPIVSHPYNHSNDRMMSDRGWKSLPRTLTKIIRE